MNVFYLNKKNIIFNYFYYLINYSVLNVSKYELFFILKYWDIVYGIYNMQNVR